MLANKALTNHESYRQEQAIIEAISNDVPLNWQSVQALDPSLFSKDINKKIISVLKEYWGSPTEKQPRASILSGELEDLLIKDGLSKDDAKRAADDFENIGSGKNPSVETIASALRAFSIDTSKNSLLHVVNGSNDYTNAHMHLVSLCRDSDGNGELCDINDHAVALFNVNHSVVKHGSKTLICEKTEDHKGNKIFEFSHVQQVRSFNSNLMYSYNAGEKIKTVNLFDLWMKSPNRKSHYGIAFDPSERTPNTFLNLWEGFAVDEIEGEELLERIKYHLRHVICDGDDFNYGYLLAWMAQIIQQPHIKTGVMIALRSDERGTGKSTVSILLERMLGQHAIRIQDSKHLTGSFNHHLANKIFVTIEEAFWSGSDKDAGKLRTMVTESTMTIEAKGKDVIEIDSYHRFLMCTNNEWTVPATKDERRYFVLDVPPTKRGDVDYFDALHKDIQNDDCISQFFNFLKNYDISKYDLRKAPATKALQEQIEQSMKYHESWLQDLLDRGYVYGTGRNHSLESDYAQIPKDDFFNDYIRYCDSLSLTSYQRIKPAELGKYIKKVLKPAETRPSINGQRKPCYQLKELHELKEMFNAYYQYT